MVDYGFRLPAALDNRPLQFEEFEQLQNQVIYVSATPAEYELQRSEGIVAEQLIRPTGLLDPRIEVEYVPRGSLRALASQYWQYGRWKRRVLLANPRSVRLRQMAAPALIVALTGSAGLLALGEAAGALIPAAYALAVAIVAFRTHGAARARVAAAFVTMHLAWGAGFLLGR